MKRLAGITAALSAGLLIAAGAGSSTAQASADHGTQHTSGYTKGNRGDALNAQLQKQLNSVMAQPRTLAKKTPLAAATVYYSVRNAPTYASLIRQGASVWNSKVSNVKLVESSSSATLDYREGNDRNGSYAYSDGHGNGYVFFDYTQMNQYSKLRVITHETGHVLGLPDHYSGPCSELMSGGGPGPSCTNAYPNSTEVTKVNRLWANGFAPTAPTFGVNPAA